MKKQDKFTLRYVNEGMMPIFSRFKDSLVRGNQTNQRNISSSKGVDNLFHGLFYLFMIWHKNLMGMGIGSLRADFTFAEEDRGKGKRLSWSC